MSRCRKHRDLVIDDCVGCLIEKNARLARRLQNPSKQDAYWECHGCGAGEPMATPCRVSCGVSRPVGCILRPSGKPKWKKVEP